MKQSLVRSQNRQCLVIYHIKENIIMELRYTEKKIKKLLRKKRLSKDLIESITHLRNYFGAVTIGYLINLAGYKKTYRIRKLRNKLNLSLRMNRYNIIKVIIYKELSRPIILTDRAGNRKVTDQKITRLDKTSRRSNKWIQLTRLGFSHMKLIYDDTAEIEKARQRRILKAMVKRNLLRPDKKLYGQHTLDVMKQVRISQMIDFGLNPLA